ncbi:PAXIP1-associated glutamate-rich protein 1 isoform X1 [Agelaius phoeniceus]|uniref:PAXIP1-associated glutamate-rich protein 1 isoform X1 n=1 Tax=Agelaius phoeniceus TaxID=39638 RepID=UPI004054B376
MSTPHPSPPSPLPPSLHTLSLTPPPKSPPKSPQKPQTSPEKAPKSPDFPPNPPEDEEEEEEEEEEDEDWGVPWSEEEEEGAEPRGGWTPRPQEIRELFEAIARAGTLPLRNVPFPRRQPTPEPPSLPEPGADTAGSPGHQNHEEKAPEPRGRSARARLDKVLQDMKRHKKLEEQILRTGRDLFPPEGPESPKRPPGLFLRHRKF